MMSFDGFFVNHVFALSGSHRWRLVRVVRRQRLRVQLQRPELDPAQKPEVRQSDAGERRIRMSRLIR